MTKLSPTLLKGGVVGLCLTWLMGCAHSGPSTGRPLSAAGVETRQDIQEAIEKVADSITQKNTQAKYCPVCGRHYAPRLKECPVDHTPLKVIEE